LAVSGVFSTDSSTSTDCNDRCTANYTEYIQSITNQSQYWSEERKTDYLLEFRNTNLGQCITAMNTTYELRPDPSCYLPQNIIDHHLDKFMPYGASSILSAYWPYGSNFSTIGRGSDSYDKNGIQWVVPYPIQTELLRNCSVQPTSAASAACVLTALGLPIDSDDMFQWNWLNESWIRAQNVSVNRVVQVHIFVYDMKELNLRMASGNEQGTDRSLWRPGGYTSDGTAEAVVDQIKGSMDNQQYCWKPITTEDGTYCYPNCPVICENAEGCTQTAC